MDNNLPLSRSLRDPALPALQNSVGLEGFGTERKLDFANEAREYLRVLIKFRRVIILLTILTVVLTTLYAFTRTPIYTALSKIRINTFQPVINVGNVQDLLQQRSQETNYIDTQLEEIRSYSLVDMILSDPEVEAVFGTEGAGAAKAQVSPGGSGSQTYRNSMDQIQRYLGSVAVKPIRRTSLVALEVSSTDAKTAALLANKHAQLYIDWVRNSRVEQQSSGLRFLNQQAEELRQRVVDLERELADYAEANSIVALNKDENITVQKMSQLNQLLTNATAKRIEAEKIYQEASASISSPSAAFDESSTQTLRANLAQLQAEYAELSAKFTDSYPRMQQLKAQISGMKGSIEGQRRLTVMGLKAKAEAATQEERTIKEELEKQKSQTFELSKKQVQYNVLNRELTSNRELLENVLKQAKATQLTAESNATNISIVDYASVPKFAAFPRKKLLVFASLLAGPLLGILCALLLNYLDNSVRTPDQLSGLLQIPCLGVVPSFETEASTQRHFGLSRDLSAPPEQRVAAGNLPATAGDSPYPPVLFIDSPKSLAAEAYRTVRTALLLSQAGHPPKTILLTSAQSSEGKTTSSINLAASLAGSGARVALLDADLRRPSISKQLRVEKNRRGLVEYLVGQASLEEIMIPDIIPRLTMIPAGRVPPNPAELLGSIEMVDLMDKLALEFDFVIIDSPPILPVTDAVVLSRYVDGVLLVVKGGKTPKTVVKDAKSRLAAVGARLLGVLLNNVDISGGDYYYYNRYYYSYYKTDDSLGTVDVTIRPGSARRDRSAVNES